MDFSRLIILACLLLGGSIVDMRATGSATGITGLYYTGQDSSGALQSGGGVDAHWNVSYAYVSGTLYSGSSTYTNSTGAYVLSSTANSGGTANYIDGAYVANTSSAQWITAPGAMTAATGGTANLGGDYLPGNGATGSNAAFYVYQLAFNISGTGSGVATNQISISLTIAADDAYAIYVTPSALTVNSSGVINAGTGYSASSSVSGGAWDNTTAVNLRNYGGGGSNNTVFNIGTNYLTIVVANNNSVNSGSSTNTALNPSGLLVYQVGALATIDGHPIVPEVGTWLPLLGALGLYGSLAFRRRGRSDGIAATV
jgi:hypothetical protein